MEEKNKDVLHRFFENLDEDEKNLIRDYLKNKTVETLSKAFDLLIEGRRDETKKD